MRIPPLAVGLAAALFAAPSLAQSPRVAVDIAPVHSLVAQVMGTLGTPDLVIQPGASPHDHSLRPSEAATLDTADIVVWVGEDLSPPLARSIDRLAGKAVVITLMDLPGTLLLDTREAAVFADDSPEHDAHGAEGEHDAHGDEDHAEADHGQDDSGQDDHGGHDHGAHDPHVWLDPLNAIAWLPAIAAALAEADPQNAATYAANAADAVSALTALNDDVAETLAPVRGRPYIVFHDAYQYFEHRYALGAVAAITISDASRPSPARVAAIRERAAEDGITCVLAEPQFNPGLVATILGDSGAEARVLDPVGAELTPGPALYATLMRDMAAALTACTAPPTD